MGRGEISCVSALLLYWRKVGYAKTLCATRLNRLERKMRYVGLLAPGRLSSTKSENACNRPNATEQWLFPIKTNKTWASLLRCVIPVHLNSYVIVNAHVWLWVHLQYEHPYSMRMNKWEWINHRPFIIKFRRSRYIDRTDGLWIKSLVKIKALFFSKYMSTSTAILLYSTMLEWCSWDGSDVVKVRNRRCTLEVLACMFILCVSVFPAYTTGRIGA